MRSAPQIRLRTIFFLIFCVTVALTVGTAEKYNAARTASSGIGLVKLEWHYALLAFGTVAVVIGLLQQAISLRKEKSLDQINDAFRFARKFAVTWRVAVASILTICVFATIFIARGFIRLPASETFFDYAVFPYAAWICCLIIVLFASVAQRRHKPVNDSPPRWRSLGAWIFGPLLAILIIPNVALIHGLVHIATHGIETAQAGRFQRANTFPDQRAEGFRSFWLSVGAVAALVFAGAILRILNRGATSYRGWRILGIGCFGLLLLIATAYCAWYFKIEFQRLSPDMANVGLAAGWIELASGGMIATLFVTIAAHRLSKSAGSDAQQSQVTIDSPLYESPLYLAAFLGAVVVYFEEVIRSSQSMLRLARSFGSRTISVILDVVTELSLNPFALLILAFGVLTLQLLWLRIRPRSKQTTWKIVALDQSWFLWNWAALLLLAAVGIPTISSFCFVFWLGPWYLYGPK
jgi:hypothetical protein